MTVFTENTEAANPLEALVGEGKKYKDVTELAKAYTHLDTFAENLKREQAEAREELGKRLSVEEQIKALALQRTEQPLATPPVTPTPVTTEKPITDEDLVARIRKVTLEDSAAQKAQANAQQVESTLITTFGSPEKANDFVNQKAAELSVSVSFLLDMAKTSPAGFYKLVDVQTGPTPSTGPSRPEINTGSLTAMGGSIKPGTKAWYNDLRQRDIKLYMSPKIQNQMMKDALEKREAFYN